MWKVLPSIYSTMENEDIVSDIGGSDTRGGVHPDEFDQIVGQTPTITTDVKSKDAQEESTPAAAQVLKYGKQFLQAVEDHPSTAAILLSVIGYILIATFGVMRVTNFLMYLAFLAIVFFPLWHPKIKSITKGINRLLLAGFFILLFTLIFEHRSLIYSIFTNIHDTLNQANSMATEESVTDSE